MTKLIKTAVIGVGHLGRYHAQKYQALPSCELVALADNRPDSHAQLATDFNVPVYSDYRELFGKVEAVSIAAPTLLHHSIAHDCLSNNLHVLVEKPITATLSEANELIELAQQKNLILQVGHLERFNPAFVRIREQTLEPRFIEAHRLAQFTVRGTDVNVILDLMIHDIDLCCHLVDSPINRIEASGASVLTDGIDIANARLMFKNGCVANLTASRISEKRERKIRIFQRASCLSADLQNNQLKVYKAKTATLDSEAGIHSETIFLSSDDAILSEICDFLTTIQDGKRPIVGGEEGRHALDIAMQISQKVSEGFAA